MKTVTIVQRIAMVLACVFVVFVLTLPSEARTLSPTAFLRVPIEAIVAIALLALLPERHRRAFAWFAGIVLGALSVVKIVSLGFSMALDRPFDPIVDAPLLASAFIFVKQSNGNGYAIGAAVAAAAGVLLILALVTLVSVRLSRYVKPFRTWTAGAAGALGAAWLVCAVAGAQITPGVPISAHDYYDSTRRLQASWNDRDLFAARIAVDPFRYMPDEDMLTALRGKNVLFVFVESYGRVAVDDPEISPTINSVLASGRDRLRTAGFASRSAFLSSPTAGGGSWLAQSTLLSGVWIDNQQRYRQLTSSDRLTLTGAFQRAHWRTVAVTPATTLPWPEGGFFGYNQIYAAKDLGYQGPMYSFSSIPDQYTLLTLHRSELMKSGSQPVMASVALLSSHVPWQPVPPLMAWEGIGDGSSFTTVHEDAASARIVLGSDREQFRADYPRAIAYSLESVISYVEKYGGDNLVLVFLGDHQPAPIVTGAGASRDVPITIVTRDEAIMSRISPWGWQEGLKPDSRAPVWRMDSFRDRFLTTFSGDS